MVDTAGGLSPFSILRAFFLCTPALVLTSITCFISTSTASLSKFTLSITPCTVYSSSTLSENVDRLFWVTSGTPKRRTEWSISE